MNIIVQINVTSSVFIIMIHGVSKRDRQPSQASEMCLFQYQSEHMCAVCTLLVQEYTHMPSIICCYNQQLSLYISTFLRFYLFYSFESSYGEKNIISMSVYVCKDIIQIATVCFNCQ
jgi:hypothetical protein